MTWLSLRKLLDPEVARAFKTKRAFLAMANDPDTDQKERVGGPKGAGRITVKRAVNLLA